MQEFMIYRINNRGKPFYLDVYKNIDEAKKHLYDMISYNIDNGYTYYVDNDFFENKYNIQMPIDFYYCIKVRDVYDWNIYCEKNKKKNNLLYYKFS